MEELNKASGCSGIQRGISPQPGRPEGIARKQIRPYYSYYRKRSSRQQEPTSEVIPRLKKLLVVVRSELPVTAAPTFNTQNLRGQTLLLRWLETGFVTTAPALGR